MSEYYCPNCGADIGEQDGFKPENGVWQCTQCGEILYGDSIEETMNRFDGVLWYCDLCGALLNEQPLFDDSCGSWNCTACGYLNWITEDEILRPETEYTCPSCGRTLNDQSFFNPDDDEYTCSYCDTALIKDGDEYKVKYRCPNCNANLSNQYSFDADDDSFTCSNCDTELVKDGDEYKILYRCPNCDSILNDQSLFYENYYYECEECGTSLYLLDNEYVIDDDDSRESPYDDSESDDDKEYACGDSESGGASSNYTSSSSQNCSNPALYCMRCGRKLSADERFCTNCGMKITYTASTFKRKARSTAKSAERKASSNTSDKVGSKKMNIPPEMQNQRLASPQSNPPSPKKRSWKGITTSLIVVLLAVIAALLYTSLKRQTPTALPEYYTLRLDVTYEDNILFNKYDIDVYVDADYIATLTHGSEYTGEVVLPEGTHYLKFYKHEKPDEVHKQCEITIEKNLTFKCNLNAERKEIKILIPDVDQHVTEIHMANYVGLPLDKALGVLEKAGMQNVSYESEGGKKIGKESQWVIIDQNIPEGTNIEVTSEVLFTCIKFDSFLKNNFIGLPALEAITLSQNLGYSKHVVKTDGLISKTLSDSDLLMEQDSWVVTKVSDTSSDEKVLTIYVKSIAEDSKEESAVAASEETETEEKPFLWFGKKDKD